MKTRWTLSALVAAGCMALIVGACTRDPAVVRQRHFEKAQEFILRRVRAGTSLRAARRRGARPRARSSA